MELNEFFAVIGSPIISEDSDHHIKIPNSWKLRHKYDLSVIRTNEPIIFPNIIWPSVLPTVDLNKNGGVSVTVAGWRLLSVRKLFFTNEIFYKAFRIQGNNNREIQDNGKICVFLVTLVDSFGKRLTDLNT